LQVKGERQDIQAVDLGGQRYQRGGFQVDALILDVERNFHRRNAEGNGLARRRNCRRSNKKNGGESGRKAGELERGVIWKIGNGTG